MIERHRLAPLFCLVLSSVLAPAACGGSGTGGTTSTGGGGAGGAAEVCQLKTGDAAPDDLRTIGCLTDFEALASAPIDATLPGARSVKVVLDQLDPAHPNALYFQNSVKFKIHYEFASTHLSGGDLPIVPTLSEFNTTEYFSPDRRFVLGAVTHYEGPGVFALEISPYDTASAAMITTLFHAVKDNAYFGDKLVFHPTSEAVAIEAKKLGADIPILTTDQLYASIDFQPLSLGSAMGRLRFAKAADLETLDLSYQDIVVLDQAPNDISVVQGLITQEFQTPLSHVNVLSQNRHTPNMGLRGALTNEKLLAEEGKLIELTVTASDWSIKEVTADEAKAFWETHKPDPVTLPSFDLSFTSILGIEDVTPEPSKADGLRDAIKNAVRAFGGKAAHYSILSRTDGVPIKKALAVPIYQYDLFMKQNGFYDMIDGFLADDAFVTDPDVRAAKLTDLRNAIMTAPLDADFQAELKAKLAATFPNQTVRFRTSTNSEDLDGFPCAGCYQSHTGDPAVWKSVLDAIRLDYSSAFLFRTFEERSYYGIDHKSVGMALIIHHNFPNEEANGVAVTNNPFDPTGVEPAFYVNVQHGGDVEVVAPPPGTTSDQFLYFFDMPNQPISYITHSNLIPAGETVLTNLQIHQLG
ncbi:MAG: PEP/pyruvate-binding domain-containing protein, partial [Byssovorax sp.]